jgi:dethiobiotin synthetase
MSRKTIFVTGTDTGIGKTAVAAMFTRCLRKRGVEAVGLKPICSGGREDARLLRAAADDALALDEVNPWHFKSALAPSLAAREEDKRVTLMDVLFHVKQIRKRFPIVIVEGAGGLLSPLGAGFDSVGLVRILRATAFVVCPNRLGAVNQLRLVLKALPGSTRLRAQCVLVEPRRPDAASSTNRDLLLEYIPAERLHVFPWLDNPESARSVRQVEISLQKLLDLFT